MAPRTRGRGPEEVEEAADLLLVEMQVVVVVAQVVAVVQVVVASVQRAHELVRRERRRLYLRLHPHLRRVIGRRVRYVPIEGLRLVDVRGIFLSRGCDWSVGEVAAADSQLGLRADVKPLLSHSATGEFNSPTKFYYKSARKAPETRTVR
eukprot:492868-Prorocentrum_minimum.AAC.1